MLFEPKRSDGKSYRVVALEVLQAKQPDQIIAYNELAKILQLDPRRHRAQIQGAVLAANKSLLKTHQRGVQAIRNVGYRMLPAREHMLVANNHQTKADRQMKRAIEFFAGTNLSELSEKELRIHQGQAMIAQALYASHQSLSRRIRRLEQIIG
jgi:hypothetical protein